MPSTTSTIRPAVTPISREMTDTAELRIPAQVRGARRVEAILDAAAALVVELGVEGVTVQALATRADTSKGSLYHFFPDVASVLRALAERHLTQIEAIVSNCMADRTIRWQALAGREVAQHLLIPLDYLERNSDLLAIVRSPGLLSRSGRSMHPLHVFVNFILGARFPELDDARCTARAAMIVAVIDGVVGIGAQNCVRGADAMREEFEDMLAIYLDGHVIAAIQA